MILGLHGKMGAGKNECAKRLALLHGNVVEVSFAAKLKESAAALIDVPVVDMERWKNDPSKCVAVGGIYDGLGFVATRVFTIREYLQRKGTEAGWQIFGDDFWSDQALPLDKDYSDALYVVTDVRFPAPTKRVRDLGGVVVGVRGPEAETGGHSSEVEQDCDVWIDNTVRDDGYAQLDDQLRDLLDLVTGWGSSVGHLPKAA